VAARTRSIPWTHVALYALLLAAGTAVLELLDFQRRARVAPGEVYVALIAGAFLLLGVFVGWRLTRPSTAPVDGAPAVSAALGLSPRELEVLHALAQGQSTKAIARTLAVSPNTIKTHLARVFDKLGAGNRMEAVARARTLGILS
jgi:DNA-binding CsgD family transcriptional regulator